MSSPETYRIDSPAGLGRQARIMERAIPNSVSVWPLMTAIVLLACCAGGRAWAAEAAPADWRIAQIDLDFRYDPKDPTVLDNKVDELIAGLKKDGMNAVFLQAFHDGGGDGKIKSVYFATTHAPVEAEVFDQAARRFQAAGFKVFAWMPTLSAQWLSRGDPGNLVQATKPEHLAWYNRATPFSRKTLDQLDGLFADLAQNTSIDGVLFQDDLFLNDFEDFSEAAKEVYQMRFGRPLTPDVRNNQADMTTWMELKTDALDALTSELVQVVRERRPEALFFRNIYSVLILQPESEEWFAQNFAKFLDLYDGVVVMAYPYLEDDVSDADAWVESLSKAARGLAGGKRSKVIMKFQTVNWKTNEVVSPEALAHWEALATENGLPSWALYPYPLP